MQHSSALFVVFVMFLVLRGKKNKTEKGRTKLPAPQNGCAAGFGFQTTHTAHTTNKANEY
jgi:hypothetical protein